MRQGKRWRQVPYTPPIAREAEPTAQPTNRTVFVTYTREVSLAPLLARLSDLGIAVVARPHDPSTVNIMSVVKPSLTVVVLKLDGSDDLVLTEIRAAVDCPILAVVPADDGSAAATALNLGADACLSESAEDDLVVAQVNALFRLPAARPPVPTQAVERPHAIRVRDLVIDLDQFRVYKGDEEVPFTPAEFRILAYLARNAGVVSSPREILQAVNEHEYGYREAQDMAKVYVRRIRQKLETDASQPEYIINVRGFGYMLERRSGHRLDEEARGLDAAEQRRPAAS